jgi:DNA polymerase III epsilon subunit-like protein
VVNPGFAVVDVETTGFSAATERIVEIAVVVIEPDGTESEAFCTLLDPGRGPGPTHVHGITAAMIDGAPEFGSVHAHLASLLSGRVVVGHNVDRFDLGFLRAECHRWGGPLLVPGEVVLLDTLVVARDRLGMYGRASLNDCCDRYGLSWEDHHSALGDARVTAALMGAMRAELGDDALGIPALLAGAARTGWPVGAAGAAAPPDRPVAYTRTSAMTTRSPAEVPPACPALPTYVTFEQPVLHPILVSGAASAIPSAAAP